MGVPKIPAKICIFKEIREAIFQVSVEHSIFHLEFMPMVEALLLFKPCSSYYSGFGSGCCQEKRICISTASLQELKELGNYEYFFRSL